MLWAHGGDHDLDDTAFLLLLHALQHHTAVGHDEEVAEEGQDDAHDADDITLGLPASLGKLLPSCGELLSTFVPAAISELNLIPAIGAYLDVRLRLGNSLTELGDMIGGDALLRHILRESGTQHALQSERQLLVREELYRLGVHTEVICDGKNGWSRTPSLSLVAVERLVPRDELVGLVALEEGGVLPCSVKDDDLLPLLARLAEPDWGSPDPQHEDGEE